jgi:inosose dehydratase
MHVPFMTRRQILPGLASFAAFPRFLRDAWGEMGNASGIRLGAQTNAWAIDPNHFDSFLDVLGQIRSIGYAGFETGFLNLSKQFQSPEQARAAIAKSGLVFFGIHIFLQPERLDPTTKLPPASLYEGVARGGAALGARRLIFSGGPATSTDELSRKIAALNAAGAFAKKAGLGFAYHNHWWEFQSKVGEIEALYTETDSDLVSFLLDAGHAYRGGADVPEFLRSNYRRIAGLHLRDYHDGKQVPLGEGSFPLADVAGTLEQLGWQGWVLNEEEREDGTKLGRSVMETSFAAMRKVFPQ